VDSAPIEMYCSDHSRKMLAEFFNTNKAISARLLYKLPILLDRFKLNENKDLLKDVVIKQI